MPVSSSAVPTAALQKPCKRAMYHYEQDQLAPRASLCSSPPMLGMGTATLLPALPQMHSERPHAVLGTRDGARVPLAAAFSNEPMDI